VIVSLAPAFAKEFERRRVAQQYLQDAQVFQAQFIKCRKSAITLIPILESRYFRPVIPSCQSASCRGRGGHGQVHHRSAFPAAGMGADEKGYFRAEGLTYEFRELIKSSGGQHPNKSGEGAFQTSRRAAKPI
jgi:hypothetical protein